MNEIMLLETHGPDGPDLSDEARRAARTRLLAEISDASTAAPYSGWRSPLLTRLGAARFRRRPLLARLALAGVGLAAMAATAIAVMPEARQNTSRPPVTADGSTGTHSTSPDRIKLVAVTAPEFPYALPMLGKPSFTADPGGPIMAVYLVPDGSDVVLTIGTARGGQPIRGQRDISVDGRPGRIVSVPEGSGVASVQLTWERRPGKWVTIVGNGRHASAEAVLQLARQVVDQPQRVGFKVTVGLVPDGWKLGGFKDGGSIISYRDPAEPNLDLHVQWTPKPDTGRDSDVEGFEKANNVTVNQWPARLVQATHFWRLTATLADGSGFTLMAPRSFTIDQVIAVARSVQLSRS